MSVLQGKYDQKSKKLETLDNDFKEYKQSVAAEKEQNEVEEFFDTAFNKIQFGKDVNDLTKSGFRTHLKSVTKIKKNEEGKLDIFDKEGNAIPNPDKANTFLTIDDVFKNEAISKEVMAKSTKAGGQTHIVTPAGGDDEDGKKNRYKRVPASQR